jgi:hypothetical protein
VKKYVNENVANAEKCIGKTVAYVEDSSDNTGGWTDHEGFVLHFTDGSKLEISAGEGQGMGYVITEL